MKSSFVLEIRAVNLYDDNTIIKLVQALWILENYCTYCEWKKHIIEEFQKSVFQFF